MLKARFKKYRLHFKQASGTSRGVLHEKDSWFLIIHHINEPNIVGIGECSLIDGLSFDNPQMVENELINLCNEINNYQQWIETRSFHFPAIRFALETALTNLSMGGKGLLFNNSFTKGQQGIATNGLVWMGEPNFMKQQIRQKIEAGFQCIKLKVGAISFADELQLLASVRNEFSNKHIELRLDANGAFNPNEALEKLKQLSEYDIQSIEQPIKPNQIELMAMLCQQSPIPIALDEELIGVSETQQFDLLNAIHPQFIILKPSLLGGFELSEKWIKTAENLNIEWWITSALESNIGLNAIAQWTFETHNPTTHGLGTGQLFTNNIASPLELLNGMLYHRDNKLWNFTNIVE